MKILTCLLFSFLSAGVFAQRKDTIYSDSLKKLGMEEVALASKKPLILIDNNVYKGLLKGIDVKTIVSINVLKPDNAKQIYGEAAKNGVIIITTNKVESVSLYNSLPDEKKILKLNLDKKPLIVIDGFLYKGNFDDIDPKEILSLDSMGEPGSSNIYGKKGENGVLLITTLKEGKRYCQWKLANFSTAYRMYLRANKNDDSDLVYVLNGLVLEGNPAGIIKKLRTNIENVQTVDFIDKFSSKLDTNNQRPIVVIVTK